MKILILANNDTGLYKFRKELILELCETYEVHISVPFGVYTQELKELGVIVHPVEIERRSVNPIKDIKLYRYYIKLLKQLKPDVVLTYTIKPNVYGGYAARRLKIPYITTITGMGSAIESRKIIRRIVVLLYRIALKKSDCVFFQNRDNLNFFLDNKIIDTNYQLINGSGVNLSMYNVLPYPDNEKIIILYIGRIMREKGISELLEVSKKLPSNLEIHLVGEFEDNYRELINQLHSNGQLMYHGFQKDVKEFVSFSNAIILPSYHEGMSNSLLEGAAMGRPLLASNIPGCKEVIDEGVNGYLFEARNSDSLFNAIVKFLSLSHRQMKEFGLASRSKVENEFDRKDIVNAYRLEIERIINENSLWTITK